MAEEKYTRCPSCRTVFRVTAGQLAMREGQVRCGHCRTLFDGIDCLVSLAPRPAEDDAAVDDPDPGPATVTLRDYRDVEPAAAEPAAETADAADREAEIAAEIARAEEAAMLAKGDAVVWREPGEDAVAPPAGPPPAAPPAAPSAAPTAPSASSAPAAAAAPAAPYAPAPPSAPTPPYAPYAPDAPATRPAHRGLVKALYGAGAVALVAGLAVQAVLHYRDWLVARFPAARPVLAEACAYIGCAVRPPREITELAIQSSDLQADPAHKGLLTLTATLRNRGRIGLAYPHLELTLTDAQDQVVARRALAPGDYAGGTADLGAGIPPNAEVPIKVFIDASATTQAGYRLYLFYP